MGFLETLKRVLGQRPADEAEKVKTAWGLYERPGDIDEPPRPETVDEPVSYDREQWRKKMKRVLEGLPRTQAEWPDVVAEARALNLDPDWTTRSQVDEFLLLIRRAVSDREFTEDEHRALDLARDLIGIPEPEAEAALRAVVAEAEAFFGRSVEGA